MGRGSLSEKQNAEGIAVWTAKRRSAITEKLYSSGDLVRTIAREHTGLLERDDREKFRTGV
jgi:hypothetical protein